MAASRPPLLSVWPQAEPRRDILRDLHFSTCQTHFLLVQDTERLRSSASQRTAVKTVSTLRLHRKEVFLVEPTVLL